MGRFNFIGSAYRSQSPLADCQTLVNWYEENIESGMGKSAKALYPVPGLNPLYTPGGPGVRGEVTFLGRSFAVIGTSLYELFAPNLAINVKNWSTAAGIPIASDGNTAFFIPGGHQLFIVSATLAYVFDLNANTLVTVDPSAGAGYPILQGAYAQASFFALVQTPNGAAYQINASNLLDATTWQGVNFTGVTDFPDQPNGIFVDDRNILWVSGPTGIQPYNNVGGFPFPFAPIEGAKIATGLAAAATMVAMDNSIFWLGQDARGSGVVWKANGFTPQRVSDHALEFALQGYQTLSDAYAYSYQDQGHTFYVLNLPTANATWAYDAATGKWARRGRWNPVKGSWDRWGGAYHTFNYGMHLVGDPSTGTIYQQSILTGTDNGNPIVRERTSPHINKEQKWIYINRVQADVEVGLANLQGQGVPTTIYLKDSANVEWGVQIDDVGVFDTARNAGDIPGTLFLNDPVSATSWQIQISTLGVLTPVAVTFNPSYPNVQQFVSSSGKSVFNLSVRQVAAGVGQIVTQQIGLFQRGPLWTLYWSRDGGQTFSPGLARDSGLLGSFMARVLWNRLGRARDWVFRIRYAEAAPARIIDLYADGDDFGPQERLVKQYAKSA